MPTATAVRKVLSELGGDELAGRAEEIMSKTSPPSSYITRFVLPQPQGDAPPLAIFEVETDSLQQRDVEGPCVVTNHFGSHEGSSDSEGRFASLSDDVSECFRDGDQMVSVEEAWAAIRAVDRSGQRFATLHSVVFRAEPWVFEIAIGEVDGSGNVTAAPRSGRRHRLARDQVFAAR